MNPLLLIKAGVTARKAFRKWRTNRAQRARNLELSGQEEKPMLKGKLTYTMILAMALQAAAATLNIDIAPGEVDALLLAGSTLLALYGRWRATRP